MRYQTKKFQGGASVTEYAILVTAIAITLIAIIVIYEQTITGKFSETKDCLESIIRGAMNCGP